MMDIVEQLAQQAAETINGGEFNDGKWYTEGQRQAWRKAMTPAANEIERLRKETEQLRSQMVLLDPNTTQEMAAAALNFANDEIKRLQKNAKRDAKYILALHRIRQTRGNEFMEAFDQAVKLYEDEQPAKATGGE